MALWRVVAKIPLKNQRQSTPGQTEIQNLRGLMPANNEINAGAQ